jgi:hypothetical protein
MEAYNIYYNSELVNNRPILKDDIINVINNGNIIKQNKITKEYEQIPLNKIKIVKCTVI